MQFIARLEKEEQAKLFAAICYSRTLLNRKKFISAFEAVRYYGTMRTVDGKGLTIPSQIRYVYYFEEFLKSNCNMPSKSIALKKVRLMSSMLNKSNLILKLHRGVEMETIYTSTEEDCKCTSNGVNIEMSLSKTIPLKEDFKVELREGIVFQ